MKKFTFFVALMLFVISLNAQSYSYPDSWGKAGFNLTETRANGVQVIYSVPSFSLDDFNVNGQTLKQITLSGSFLPNDEGMPNLPGQGRFIAIPQGATPRLNVVSQRTEVIHNVDIVPASNIPAENDDSPLKYVKNAAAYSTNANFPAESVTISEVQNIRGVDVVMLGISPFQYNPVTKDLIVYHDLKVDISFDGGNGHYGDDAYRNRWFDPILEDALLNYNTLPSIDYSNRFQLYSNNTRNEECEYIIITPTGPDFLSWADSISNFRNQQGILTKVYTIDEIGGNTASAIELWIDNAYNTWTIKPVACLMLGDFGSDPTKSLTSPIVTMSGETFPTDHKLGDVNNDDMAEIVFARIVANNNTQLTTICTKFLNYERNPIVDTGYYQHPITALGWQTERWFQLCSEIVGGYFRSKGKHPVRINEIYAGTPGNVWSTASNTSSVVNYFGPSGLNYIPQSPNLMPCCWNGGNSAQINSAINSGAFMLQHRDHGMETGWGEPSYTNVNIDQLTNTKLTFVMSINCLTGKYNWGGECFGERFIRHTKNGNNSGALGLVCPSEVSYSFVNDTFVWGMYDNMWTDFMPSYGTNPASRGACPAFGMVAGKYFLKQSNWPYNTGDKKITYYLFHMHGDAFLRLFYEQPQVMTINHAPQILEGETVFTVTANEGSDIALTVNNEIIALGVGLGSTPAAITIPSQAAGTIVMVTITKQNFYRYSSMVPVINNILTPEFTANATNLCHNSTADFTDLSTGNPISWEWSFEGGTPASSIDQNPAGINYATSGNYNVTLVVHSTDSVKTITKNAYIHVFDAPVAAFTSTSPCVGNQTSFTDESIGNGEIISWNWTFGDPLSGSSDSSVLQNPAHTYSLAGSYIVNLTVRNAGCSIMASQQASVLTSPEIAAIPTGNDSVCAGSVTSVTTTGALYATTYEWKMIPVEAGTISGNTTDAEITLAAGYIGPVAVTVRGINDCDTGAFSAEFNITVKPVASAPVVPSGVDSVDVHLVVTSLFTTTGTADKNDYSWFITPSEVGTVSGTNKTGTVTWNNNYTGGIASITVKAIDECGPGISSEVKNVILKNSVGISNINGTGFEVFPNPSSGKFNFRINGFKNIESLKIINTIGSVVYTQKNISANSLITKTIDITSMPDGVYFIKMDTGSGLIIKKLVIRK